MAKDMTTPAITREQMLSSIEGSPALKLRLIMDEIMMRLEPESVTKERYRILLNPHDQTTVKTMAGTIGELLSGRLVIDLDARRIIHNGQVLS